MEVVNLDGTEKVMEHHSCQTATLTNDVIQNLTSLMNNNVHSLKKQDRYNFQKFQLLIPKYPMDHQYLLETSYIKLISTMGSIH